MLWRPPIGRLAANLQCKQKKFTFTQNETISGKYYSFTDNSTFHPTYPESQNHQNMKKVQNVKKIFFA